MHRDYMDALRYAHDAFKRIYLAEWNIKEENNMDIPGKLRQDLKRIYGANDPLNYIEDIRVEPRQWTGADEEMLCVKLRVPARVERFVCGDELNPVSAWEIRNSLMYGPHCLGDWGVPKAPEPKPEKKIDPMEAVDFLKPKRIIFSGPKTIVFWPDGTKTVVSLMEGQEYNEYTAFCAAVVKKMFGATHKAKQFLEVVAVRPEPKPKKVKEEPIQEEVAPASDGVETGDKYANMETIPMPGTEDPDWGRKHWCPDAPVLVEEEDCNGGA